VHAEANAIISASRNETIGSTLYLVGREVKTGELLATTTPCSMCRRMIINAGIKNVVSRVTETEYVDVPVEDWIVNDDTVR
jgi:dCMP deaminase